MFQAIANVSTEKDKKKNYGTYLPIRYGNGRNVLTFSSSWKILSVGIPSKT